YCARNYYSYYFDY
nr:immunoglobulin heavy chain junction region [Mus musculus]